MIKGAAIQAHWEGYAASMVDCLKPKPVRIQRKRTAGYSMQAESRAINGLPCMSVTRPGRWGNPFNVRIFGRELSLKLFRNTIQGVWYPSVMDGKTIELFDLAYQAHNWFLKRRGAHPLHLIRQELGGHNLSCYCSLEDACHADILLEFLNTESAG